MTASMANLVVLSLVLAACTPPNSRVATRSNNLAGLGLELSASSDPLQWKVITSGVNPKNSTMYTLYGNDFAVRYARTSVERNYPIGANLALVTWQQQEDVRWFGAKFPARPNSVEFLSVEVSADGRSLKAYRLFEGSPLKEVTIPESQAETGATHLLSLRAAVMP